MTVKITNLSGSTFTTSLYHDQYCLKGAECKCKDTILTRSVPKGSGVTHIKKKLSASLSIAPGQTVSGLHNAVAELSHIIDAQKTRPPVLKVVQEKDKKIAVAKEEPPIDAPVISADVTKSVQQSEDAEEQRSKSARKRRSARSANKEYG